jgi:HPt (histidine-containing phosphotransfer) domain-containing protein
METPDGPLQSAENEGRAADEQSRGTPIVSDIEVMDLGAALDRVGGDAVLLAEIAKLFLQEYPTQVAAIQAAVAAGNAPELERAAHSLKGSVANFAAPAVVDAARALEELGRERRLDSAAQLTAVLERRLEQLRVPLAQLAAEPNQ